MTWVASDLVGLRVNRLVAIRRGENSCDGKARWVCKCDCGTEKTIRAAVLRLGRIVSCGCYAREQTSQRSRIHGLTGSAEHNTWLRILSRCNSKSNDSYQHYGGRGIRVCRRWSESFGAFLSDMGPRPSSRHSIDRIDVDGDYEPGNCRWASISEQNNNKRSNRILTAQGESATATEWARRLGTSATTIIDRLKRGWSEEKAATQAVARKRKRSWRTE